MFDALREAGIDADAFAEKLEARIAGREGTEIALAGVGPGLGLAA